MDAQTLNELKTVLEKKERELSAQLKAAADYPDFASAGPGQVDEDAEADESEEYTTRLALGASLKEDLARVTRALGRISQGTYGRCTACGKEIAAERLQAYPEAETCGCT